MGPSVAGSGAPRAVRRVIWEAKMAEDLRRRVALITGVTGQDGSYLAE